MDDGTYISVRKNSRNIKWHILIDGRQYYLVTNCLIEIAFRKASTPHR